MESGSELSKTVATFILQKILLDDSGLSYICQTYDRQEKLSQLEFNFSSVTINSFISSFTGFHMLQWY